MLQTTAMARITRSLGTKTRPGANEPGGVTYREGDLVDIFRPPASKDTSGWKGPHRVVRTEPADGQIIVTMHGKDRPNRIGDVRHTLFCSVTFMTLNGMPNDAVRSLLAFASSIETGHIETFGSVFDKQMKSTTTRASCTFPKIVLALTHVLDVCFGLDPDTVCAVRLARGVPSLPSLIGMSRSLVIVWMDSESLDDVIVLDATNSKVSIISIVENWREANVMQVCYADSECMNLG